VEAGTPEERLVEALRGLLAAAASRRGRETRRPGELSFAQIKLARRLYERGPLTANRLAEAAHLSPSAASEMLDGLERAGVISREQTDADRRARIISLTQQGRTLVEEKLRAFRVEVGEALVDCTDRELVAAARVLDRLTEMFARR
jgi:DNA-binding MarR family transcriptional regulator